jgi:uncharacterized protein (DUF849 family)
MCSPLVCQPSIQIALNGTRSRADHVAIPISPGEQAMDAQAAVAQGASGIHVHIRDQFGQESLDPDDVGQSLEAIRRACPGIPVGISTGAWIVPDLQQRLALIRSWSVLPDCASVNLHEAGSADMIRALLDRGIGVEAGIWNAPAACALVASGLADDCVRVLLEPAEASCRPRANLTQIEAALAGVDRPRLLHGLGRSVWEFVQLAAEQQYETRIGFEDTLTLPDGTRAASNAELLLAARRIVQRSQEMALRR